MFKLKEAKSGIPVYVSIAGENVKPENIEEDFAYIVCNKGVYIKRNNFVYSGFFKTEGKCLGDIDENIRTKFDFRIPWKLFLSIESLFEKIYDKYKSEVAVLLFYNKEKKEWAYGLPQQTVTGSSVDYDIKKGCSYVMESELSKEVEELQGEWSMVGSIHSHASMSAFHSGTDDKDEFGFDGIHITIGKLNERNHEYACRMMFGKTDIKKNLDDVVCCPTKADMFPKEIVNKVTESAKTYYHPTTSYYGNYGSDGWSYENGRWVKTTKTCETPELPMSYTGLRENGGNTQSYMESDYVYKNGIVMSKH